MKKCDTLKKLLSINCSSDRSWSQCYDGGSKILLVTWNHGKERELGQLLLCHFSGLREMKETRVDEVM